MKRKRATIQTLLREGYAELANEAKRCEREFEWLDIESLKYIEEQVNDETS